jgi:hypothetical protein
MPGQLSTDAERKRLGGLPAQVPHEDLVMPDTLTPRPSLQSKTARGVTMPCSADRASPATLPRGPILGRFRPVLLPAPWDLRAALSRSEVTHEHDFQGGTGRIALFVLLLVVALKLKRQAVLGCFGESLGFERLPLLGRE